MVATVRFRVDLKVKPESTKSGRESGSTPTVAARQPWTPLGRGRLVPCPIRHDLGVIDRFRRMERWLDRLWMAGPLVVLAMSIGAGRWWLAALAGAWTLLSLRQLVAPRQAAAEADLPPRDPAYRTPFDPPRHP
jgi:hypothetical protein